MAFNSNFNNMDLNERKFLYQNIMVYLLEKGIEIKEESRFFKCTYYKPPSDPGKHLDYFWPLIKNLPTLNTILQIREQGDIKITAEWLGIFQFQFKCFLEINNLPY